MRGRGELDTSRHVHGVSFFPVSDLFFALGLPVCRVNVLFVNKIKHDKAIKL